MVSGKIKTPRVKHGAKYNRTRIAKPNSLESGLINFIGQAVQNRLYTLSLINNISIHLPSDLAIDPLFL
jgi:hypothetical protein